MESDLNRYDAFHVTVPHPKMTREEWLRAYHDAWTAFYAFEPMRQSLLRQNPHTYWAVLKNLIWYRAGMSEDAHPMVTGFFRLKDRRSRRPGFPIEGRVAFWRRRVREMAGQIKDYAMIYLEMQELWLLTRIRHSDYEFLGDLRKVASRSMQEVKLNWAHVHTVMADRLLAVRESFGHAPLPDRGPLSARLEAMRRSLGTRAGAIGQRASSIRSSVGERAGDLGHAVGASFASAGRSLSAGRSTLQALLGDLRLRLLPPVPRRSWAHRAAARLNVLSTQRLRAHRDVREYWERTWSSALHLQFWRVNPLRLTYHLIRDTHQALVFLMAMRSERY
jgi:hypothetical protein